jgi:hypothetical protein
MLPLLIAACSLALGEGEGADAVRLPTSLSADAEADVHWSLRIAPVYRQMFGSTKVRELNVTGTRLSLREEVGLDQAVGGNLQGDVDTPSLYAFLELEELFGFGGRSSSQDFNWNGTPYAAPSQVRAHSSFLTLRTQVAFKTYSEPGTRAWVGPLVGLEWPYYTVSIGTNRQHGSIEEWQHYLPYPVLGAAGSLPLGETWTLQARLSAGYLPNVPSPFTEGGRLYVSARPSVFLEVPLLWRLGTSVDLTFAATYQYWQGGDHSNEDDNRLTFSSVGLMVGTAFRW